MVLRNFDIAPNLATESSPDVDSFSDEPTRTQDDLLGARAVELAYGTGGVLSLDPEHEDAQRYPNPGKREDAKPSPQDEPPQQPKR